MAIQGLRQQIDELDHKLIQLLCDRLHLSEQVAKYKRDKNLPTTDEKREQELLQNRIQEFKEKGVDDPEFVKAIFYTVINKSKPMLKLDEIDPIFLDIVKKHNLGTKISGVGIHGMKPGTDSEAGHLHERARGVYYLQAQEGVGNLLFPDLDITIKPHRGLFVVVPSKENHAIGKNTSDEIRLALAFYIE